LLEAAAAGTLRGTDDRMTQFDRIIGTPSGRLGVRRFFEEWLQLDGTTTVEKDTKVFPLFSTAVAAAMKEQSLRALDRLIFERKDMRDLFTEADVEINDKLAPIYGAQAGPAWVRKGKGEIGARSGVLTWPALLSLHAKTNKTSITGRGIFIRTELLCQGIPEAPPEVPTLPPFDPNLTTRQLFEQHRAMEPCRTCHAAFDPLGMALEAFDGIGKARTKEGKVDIDPSGDLDGKPFADAVGLGALLREEPAATACMIAQLHRYVAGRLEAVDEGAWLGDLHDKFKQSSFEWLALVRAYVASDEFTQVLEAL